MDIGGFLAEHPPFLGLSQKELSRIAGATQVEFFPAGTTIELVQFLERPSRTSAPHQRESYSLEETAVRFGIPAEQAHHALDDASMTAELFLVVAARLAGQGKESVRGLLRTANRR